MATYTKIDVDTIEATTLILPKTTPGRTEIVQYDIGFLREQKVRVDGDLVSITARHAQEIADAQANVAEIDTLLAECAKLGIR